MRLLVVFDRALISSLAALLPQLDGDHNKFIKFRVERFLGVLIGYFGPIIGYEYKYVDSSAVRGILRQKKKSNVKVNFTIGYIYFVISEVLPSDKDVFQ